MNDAQLLDLAPDQQRREWKKLLERAGRVGGDPIAEAKLAGQILDRNVWPRDFVVAELLRVTTTGDSALATLSAKARAKKPKELRRGYDMGASDRLARELDLDGLRLESDANVIAARKRAQKRADEIIAAEEADDDSGLPDYADVAAIIANGVERRVPDAGGVRNDGVRLAYHGAVNGLVGPPESGKTLVAIAQACDEIKAGGSVLHVDGDHNGADSTIAHYLAGGVDRENLGDPSRNRYVELRSADHLRRVVADAAEWKPSIVIIDSIGEVVPLFGGDSNSNDDYRRIHREVILPFARLGAAVLVLDHVTKADPAGGYAIGAGSKKAAIDGSYLAVANVEPFVPGVGGAAALTILKDRHGGLRAASPSGKAPTAAVFRLDSRGGSSTWEFWRGRDTDEKATEQAEADVRALRDLDPPPGSKTDVKTRMSWGSDRAHAALTKFRALQVTTLPIDPEPVTPKKSKKKASTP